MKEGFFPSYSEPQAQVPEVPNTSVVVSPDNLDRLRSLIDKTLGFADKTSCMIGKEYLDGLNKYLLTERHLSNSIVPSILKRHSMHLPKLELYDHISAQKVLDQIGFGGELIDPNALLLVFKLPRLSSLVWKNIDEFSSNIDRKKVRKTVWHKLGHKAKLVFLDNSKLYSNSKTLSFGRINGFGDHDPNFFYYLHEVTKPPPKKNKVKKKSISRS